MTPLKYQVVGEEDYSFSIEIGSSGDFLVSAGTYTSQPPRKGTLSQAQEQELLDAIRILGIPEPHPMPDGSEAFGAQLVIGEGKEEFVYPFWEGALEQDDKLRKLVRLLEKL